LTIVAPAATAGGWDQTARALEEVLEKGGLVADVEVHNSPGAGGAIGLAQFVNAERGNAHALLVGGLVMVDAIRASHATVSLRDATPIARITGEYEVVVVPAASRLHTLADLVAVVRESPGALSWAGGSDGGTDHLLVSLLAERLGVPAVSVNYVAFAGGGEAAHALLEHQFSTGAGGYGEFAPYIRSGRLRALGIAAEARVPGLAVPTLREQGIDIVLENWRGVFAPPGIDAPAREALVALISAAVADPLWRDTLARYYWIDRFLAGTDFERFVEAELARVESAPDSRRLASGVPRRDLVNLWSSVMRTRWLRLAAATASASALLLAGLLAWQRRRARQREQSLARDLAAARADAHMRLCGLGDEIERQFEAWRLTTAEREVALLMLKGLRHKEIADVRKTSERTVRQQSLSIYRKAGLEGRTDLAAFFLEDLLAPSEARPRTA